MNPASLLKKERAYFHDRIPAPARRIVRSNVFKTVANPLTTIFLNAFVWRATGSLYAVSIYNICQYIGLPIAFYINGLILRRTHIQNALGFGAVLAGLAAAAVVLFGNIYPSLIPMYGALWGLGNGFYWSNRNYLELQETHIEWRQYFYGIIYAINSLANILVPLIAGWFIVGGAYFNLFSAVHAYWIVFGISFLLLLVCARIMMAGEFESPQPKIIVRPIWKSFFGKRRLMQMASGFFDGVEYLGVLLVLYLVGSEGILGSISAVAALCTVIALYVYGRYAKHADLTATFVASGLLFLLSAIILAATTDHFGIIFYAIFMEVALAFSGVATSTLFCSLTEEDMAGDTASRYSYIFDNELFLNIGRILGCLIIVVLVLLSSQHTGLFYGPVIIALVHVTLIAIFLAVRKQKVVR